MINEIAKRELRVFILNTREAYKKFYEPLENQIISYLDNQKFNYDKALKGLYRVCNDSARLYCCWYGGNVRSCFPAELKKELSKDFLDDILSDYGYNAYSGYAEVVENSEAEPVSKGA